MHAMLDGRGWRRGGYGLEGDGDGRLGREVRYGVRRGGAVGGCPRFDAMPRGGGGGEDDGLACFYLGAGLDGRVIDRGRERAAAGVREMHAMLFRHHRYDALRRMVAIVRSDGDGGLPFGLGGDEARGSDRDDAGRRHAPRYARIGSRGRLHIRRKLKRLADG